MRKAAALTTALLAMLMLAPAQAAPPVHKCEVNGTTTFQQGPCATGQVRKQPTVEQLNAEQKKRREAAAAAGAGRAAAAPVPSPAAHDTPNQAPILSSGRYKCDGRTHCSQMTSCAEAKYFLANCPGVTMDGDHDGIPCEQQWCAR